MLWAYDNGAFVRFSIVDKRKDEVVGTIELFNRKAEDYFNDYGLLRLDLRWDYENTEEIKNIVSLVLQQAFDLFQCKRIATKAPTYAIDRVEALKDLGFVLSKEYIAGYNGTSRYDGYWVMEKNQ